jgi:hypothetical protein
MATDMVRLGTSILIEFQKPDFRPLFRKPLADLFQAISQASRLGFCGRAKIWPRRISSIDLSEVTIIT